MQRKVLASAQAELEEAFDFYESRQLGLGHELTADFESAVKEILRNPRLDVSLPEMSAAGLFISFLTH